MYKIDYKFNNGYAEYLINGLLNGYTEYLGKDLVELFKKIKDTKPEFITEKEKELILDIRNLFESLHEDLSDIYGTIDDEEDEEEDEEDEEDEKD